MSGKIAVTRNDLTSAQLRQASSRAADGAPARRMLALALVLEGVERGTAAQTCGMDRQTLRDWVHRYNAQGLAGLQNRKAPGRKASCVSRESAQRFCEYDTHKTKRQSAEQRAQLEELVNKGPDPETDEVVRWRRVDLKKQIETLFGVAMHERTVGKQLKAMGFVKITTRPQHPKSDEEAQDAFKKTSQRP